MSENVLGMIGLGLLGSAMSERFAQAGFDVVGFDIDQQRCDEFRQRGGHVVDSAAEVVQRCDRVVLSLPTSKVVANVVDEVFASIRPGATFIDTTTGDPQDVADCGARLSKSGVNYLDATVAGSSKQARAGEVITMVGGSKNVFDRCRDVFDAFARQSFYVGPNGAGARMKLVVNLVIGLNRAVMAEGLAFARKYDLDPSVALEILKSGPAYSRVMDMKGQKMLNRDFSTEARLTQHLKDVRLILAAGEGCDATMPLSTLHRELLEQVEADGFGDADNSAICTAFD